MQVAIKESIVKFDAKAVENACLRAREKAYKAAMDFDNKSVFYGCGFAWINIHGVRSNSKLGKELAKHGFKKAYGYSGLLLWNPSRYATQNVAALEAGAEAYAAHIRQALNLAEVFTGSRLD